jgi:glycosidase
MQMKKIILCLGALIGVACSLSALEISRIEPAFWWVGMKNPELQLLVHGKDIALADLQIDYPGVRLKEAAKSDNPDYLFLYLEIAPETRPGILPLTFKKGRQTLVQGLELKPRAKTTGAQGFNSADVLYLIMPDRFANGDPTNDCWDNEPVDRSNPSARHGGDFAGIRQHLNYIRDLGVTAIWLNPVLENKMHGDGYQSYHGYAATNFYAVDPRFGSNDDYCRLVEDAHRMGLKMVMDLIYNHCGSRHPWMKDRPDVDWFNHPEGFVPASHNLYAVMDIHAPESEAKALTDGWFVEAMPDLNQRNRHLATYLIQNSIWWIEYARIDGIRHDTHPYADANFLRQWCRAVFEEYPDFNIVGESWYPNAAPLAWWQAGSRLSQEDNHLKTVMDFALMTACDYSFSIENKKNNPLRGIYETIAQDFLYENADQLLVFLDNHDTSRFCKSQETSLDRYRQALTLILTTRGIPQIYYGSEILMTGEKQDGDGNLRKDFPGGWGSNDPVNAFTQEGRSARQNEAFDFLRRLLRWRAANRAVTGGKLIHYPPNRETECYVYARIRDQDRALIVLNGSDQEQSLDPAAYADVINNAAAGQDALSKERLNLKENLKIRPKGVLIIELLND